MGNFEVAPAAGFAGGVRRELRETEEALPPFVRWCAPELV